MNDPHQHRTDPIDSGAGAADATRSVESIPQAEVHTDRSELLEVLRQRPSKSWVLTLICLLIAVALFWSGLRQRSTSITVQFEQGHGIKPGDRLQHRGIEVGEVTAVTLDDNLSQVDVEIELETAAAGLARQGSRFWIERPRISLARVSGLETVVGAKFIGVVPGPQTAARTTRFKGEETPPTLREAASTEPLEILIRFSNGHGLTTGDVVKFRGIVVGEIVDIALNERLDGIDVQVRLAASGRLLARAGTRFWIERPRVQLTGISGLDTLTGGQHIATAAGPDEAPAQVLFDGLDEPPGMLDQRPGGLEFVIYSQDREGINRGAPLTHRGLQIGHIVAVGLSADAAQIETRLYVDPAYRSLIRQNSVFWSVGGIDASFGFGGLQISSDTLATIAVGGIAMGTPDPPGGQATLGAKFTLSEEPNGWRQWTPRIPIGTSLLPHDTMLPQPVRVALIWQQRFLGLAQSTQATGWGLRLADQRLIAPANVMVPPTAAIGGVAELQFDGTKLATTAKRVGVVDGLAVLSLPDAGPGGWPVERIRKMTAPEDCLIVFGGLDATRSLPATRLTIKDGRLSIDDSFSLPIDAHGASVVAVRDGLLVGMIAMQVGRPALLNVTPTEAKVTR